MSKMDIQIVNIKAGLIERRKEYEDMGYDTRHAFLLPFKLEPRFRTLIETLKEFTDMSDGGKLFDVCPELNLELKRLCQSLVFLVNSASYRKGVKYCGFDKMEIDLKLGRKRGKHGKTI